MESGLCHSPAYAYNWKIQQKKIDRETIVAVTGFTSEPALDELVAESFLARSYPPPIGECLAHSLHPRFQRHHKMLYDALSHLRRLESAWRSPRLSSIRNILRFGSLDNGERSWTSVSRKSSSTNCFNEANG
jgi:hypothetical protein